MARLIYDFDVDASVFNTMEYQDKIVREWEESEEAARLKKEKAAFKKKAAKTKELNALSAEKVNVAEGE